MTDTKSLVENAVTALLVDRDVDSVDSYISPTFIQHSAVVSDGRAGVRDLVENLPDEFRYETARVIADKDLVVLHSVFYEIGPQPMVSFDLFRIEGGLADEHWDCWTPLATDTVSGRGQLDGPTTVTDLEHTDRNRELVREFVSRVLVGGEYPAMSEYLRGDSYLQHNPAIADGLSGLRDFLAVQARRGVMLEYQRLHRVVAEGQFVFTQSEGTFGARPYAFYDLYRVHDGAIVEHWDVMSEIASAMPHDNGPF